MLPARRPIVVAGSCLRRHQLQLLATVYSGYRQARFRHLCASWTACALVPAPTKFDVVADAIAEGNI